MTTIIAVLALLVSLIALWLGSANLKKLESGTKEIKNKIGADMAAMKDEIEKKVATIARGADAFDAKLEAIREGQTKAGETAGGLQAEIDKVRKELDALLFNLPAKYKQPQQNEIKREFG